MDTSRYMRRGRRPFSMHSAREHSSACDVTTLLRLERSSTRSIWVRGDRLRAISTRSETGREKAWSGANSCPAALWCGRPCTSRYSTVLDCSRRTDTSRPS